MRKVIDLCLDMPPDAGYLFSMLETFCLNPDYAGYKNGFGRKLAAQVGYTIEEFEGIIAAEGEDVFRAKLDAAAKKHAPDLDDFVRHLGEIGVEWGVTVSHSHDNRETGEIVRKYPNKFKGFAFVDPNEGMKAVRELETAVKEHGLHALYLTAFRTRLTADDRRNYPLYAKACELGIPVHIYCSVNMSKAVPYDIAHPRYIDQVARDFPELRIMAGVSGFPWVLDFISLAYRHENIYLNFETYAPESMNQRGSGTEAYLYHGENRIRDRLCFATNWAVQCIPVEELIAQVETLPFRDSTKDKILYENAARFYDELG